MSEEAVQSQIEHDYFQGLAGNFDYTPSDIGTEDYIAGVQEFLIHTDLDRFIDSTELMKKPAPYRKATRILVDLCIRDFNGQIEPNTTHSSSNLIKLIFTGQKDYRIEVITGYLKTISQLKNYFSERKDTEIDPYYRIGSEDLLKELKILKAYILRVIEPKETLEKLTEEFEELRLRRFPDKYLERASELQRRITEIKKEISLL